VGETPATASGTTYATRAVFQPGEGTSKTSALRNDYTSLITSRLRYRLTVRSLHRDQEATIKTPAPRKHPRYSTATSKNQMLISTSGARAS
jgi:hypothetical protein